MTAKPFWLMDNNFIDPDNVNFSYSSQVSASFPASNIYDENRAKVWIPGGNFTISSSNCKLYFDDGSAQTATLTNGNYTYTTLASHIQTVMNAISSNWTCSYSTTTNKFTINRTSGAAELTLSTTTDAVWDTIGFVGSSDLTTAPFPAQEQRNHTNEYILIDCLAPTQPTFVGLIGPIADAFIMSTSATIKLQGNGVDSWTSPSFEKTLTITDYGAFAFLDDDLTTDYRFWRLNIVDRLNPVGPSGFRFSNAYIGDHETVSITNIANGFTMRWVDDSSVQRSDNGTRYFGVKPRYRTYDASIKLVQAADRRDFQDIALTKGVVKPFFIALDPGLELSTSPGEYTFYARFDSAPDFQHVIRDYYDFSFALTEVV